MWEFKQAIWMCFMIFISVVGSTLVEDFMTTSCNVQLKQRVSGRLETSTSLTYNNLMDCYTTIAVASGKRILLLFNRIEIEEALKGKCVDSLTVYDGAGLTGRRLLNESCGVHTLHNLTSTVNYVTMYFRSDNTAVFRGFDVVYTAFSYAPCSGGDFACSNGLCIDGSLQCDAVGQCGDNSDEFGCAEKVQQKKKDGLKLGLIIGGGAGGALLLLLLACVGHRMYEYYKWKGWLKKNLVDTWDNGREDGIFQYPVTDMYSKYEVGKRGRRPPVVVPYTDDPQGFSEMEPRKEETDEATPEASAETK